MIHLSSYHSNGLPTVVWSNKVNLIGEKVYKPKIHFCENCNKPILIYGRLIPCKHVFCFTCATLCLTHQPHQQSIKFNSANSPSSIVIGPSEPPPSINNLLNQSSPMQNYSPHNSSNNLSGSLLRNNTDNNYTNHLNDKSHHHRQARTGNHTNNSSTSNSNNNNCHHKNIDHKGESNQSLRDLNNSTSMNIDESTSNTTPTTIHQDNINSPTINGTNNSLQGQISVSKGCHRCGGRALRVERNSLNSIFVCQVETCRRTYLSARDLQAHVNHRHSRGKSNQNAGASGSLAAISSSPYISSSMMHLNNQGGSNRSNSNLNSTHDPSNHSHRHRHGDRDSMNHRHHRDRERDRHKDRDTFQRERERERDSKEYHRQSLQRAAQWAEASAQLLEKGITR